MLFKVTVLKWREINPGHKPGMNKFYMKSGILTNPKIANLKPIEFMLYTHCLCVASESSTDDIQITSKSLPKQLRMGDKSLTNHLKRIESFQLLKVDFESDNIIKLNIIKDNIIKSPAYKNAGTKKPPISDPDDPFTLAKKSTWESYRLAYEKRWGITPRRNAAVNKQIEHFVKRLGNDESPKVIEFYCQHKDSFYVKKAHPFSLALKDAESLYTQWKKGIQITQTKMREYDRKSEYQDMMEQIDLQAEKEREAEKGL